MRLGGRRWWCDGGAGAGGGLWNSDTVTEVFAQTNQGRSFTGLDPNLRYGAVRERIRPLMVRLGVAAEL